MYYTQHATTTTTALFFRKQHMLRLSTTGIPSLEQAAIHSTKLSIPKVYSNQLFVRVNTRYTYGQYECVKYKREKQKAVH